MPTMRRDLSSVGKPLVFKRNLLEDVPIRRNLDLLEEDSVPMQPVAAMQESTGVAPAGLGIPEQAPAPAPDPFAETYSTRHREPMPDELRQLGAGALDLVQSPFAVFEAKATRMMAEPEAQEERKDPEWWQETLTPDILKLGEGMDAAVDGATEAVVSLVGPERVQNATAGVREYLTAVRDEIVAGLSAEAQDTLKEPVGWDNLGKTVFNSRWWSLNGARMAPTFGAFMLLMRTGARLGTGKMAQKHLTPQALEAAAGVGAATTAGLGNSVIEAGSHMVQRLEEGVPREVAAEETAEVARNAFVISSMLGAGLAGSALKSGAAATVLRSSMEPVEEGLQQISGNLAAGKPWHEGIADAVILSLPFGVAESGIVSRAGQKMKGDYEGVRAEVIAEFQQTLQDMGDKRNAILNDMKARQDNLRRTVEAEQARLDERLAEDRDEAVAEQRAERGEGRRAGKEFGRRKQRVRTTVEAEQARLDERLAEERGEAVEGRRLDLGLKRSKDRSRRESITSELKPVLQPESVRRELMSPIPFRGQEEGPSEVIRPTDEPYPLREMELEEGDRFTRNDKEYVVQALREKSILAKPIVEAKTGIPVRNVSFNYGTKALPVQPAALAELVETEENGVETVPVAEVESIEDEFGEFDSDAYGAAEELFNRTGVRLLRNKDVTSVIKDGDRVVGALATSMDSDGEFSFDIAVDPDVQRQGYGSKLFERALDEFAFQSEGYENPTIRLDAISAGGRALAEKHGFEVSEAKGEDRATLVQKTAPPPQSIEDYAAGEAGPVAGEQVNLRLQDMSTEDLEMAMLATEEAEATLAGLEAEGETTRFAELHQRRLAIEQELARRQAEPPGAPQAQADMVFEAEITPSGDGHEIYMPHSKERMYVDALPEGIDPSRKMLSAMEWGKIAAIGKPVEAIPTRKPAATKQGQIEEPKADVEKSAALQAELKALDKEGAPKDDPRRTSLIDKLRKVVDESQNLHFADTTIPDFFEKLGARIRTKVRGKRDYDPGKYPGMAFLEEMEDAADELQYSYANHLLRSGDLTGFTKAIFKAASTPSAIDWIVEPVQSLKRIDNVMAPYMYEMARSIDTYTRNAQDVLAEKGKPEIKVEQSPMNRFKLIGGAPGMAEVMAAEWVDGIKLAGKSKSGLTKREMSDVSRYFKLESIITRESKALDKFNRLKELKLERDALNAQVRAMRGKKGVTAIRAERNEVRAKIKSLAKFAQTGDVFDASLVNPWELTSADAKAALAEMADALGPEAMERFENAKWATDKIWGNMLDYLADAGVISEESWLHLRESAETHGEYLGPFEVIEHWANQADMGAMSQKKMDVYDQDIIKGMKGTNKDVRGMLEATIDKLSRVTSLGERNKAIRSIHRVAKMDPEIGNAVRVLKAGEDVPLGFDVLHYLDDGNKITIAVPQPIADAVKTLSAPMTSWMMKALSHQSAILRTGATALSATFAVRNIPRDLYTQYIHADNPLRPWSMTDIFLLADSFLTAMVDSDGEVMREYKRWGAGYASYLTQGQSALREAKKKTLITRRPQKDRRAQRLVGKDMTKLWMHPLNSLMEAMTAFSQATEQTTRLATFRKVSALEAAKGGRDTPSDADFTKAALQARENSIDFHRGGKALKFINHLSPFVNAGAQGFRTTVRGIARNPLRAAALLAAGAAAVTALHMENRDDYGELIDMIPEDLRKKNFVMIIGKFWNPESKRTEPLYLLFPKGDFLSSVTAPIEDFLDHLYVEKGDLYTTVMNAASEASPYDFMRDGKFSPGLLVGRVLPPALRVTLEKMANKNFYFDQELESKQMQQDRYPYQRYKSGTSLGARMFGDLSAMVLGEENSFSPVVFDNTVRGMTAEAGAMALRIPEMFKDPGEIPGRPMRSAQDVEISDDLFGFDLRRRVEPLDLPLKDIRRWSLTPGVKALINTRAREQDQRDHSTLDDVGMKFGSARWMQDEPVKDLVSKAVAGELGGEEYRKFMSTLTPRQKSTLEREVNKRKLGINDAVFSRLRQMPVGDFERAFAIVELMNSRSAEQRKALLIHLMQARIINTEVAAQMSILQNNDVLKPARKPVRTKAEAADALLKTLGIVN